MFFLSMMEPKYFKDFSVLSGYILYMRDLIVESPFVTPLVDVSEYNWRATPEQITWKITNSLRGLNRFDTMHEALILYNVSDSRFEIEHTRTRGMGDDIALLVQEFEKRSCGQKEYELDLVIIGYSQPPQPPGGLPLAA